LEKGLPVDCPNKQRYIDGNRRVSIYAKIVGAFFAQRSRRHAI
jgi:hypothetical protein